MLDQATTLRRLVSRISPAQSEHGRSDKIVLTGAKGGVGTTTLAINLAAALQDRGKSVLLVDAHPTRGDIATMCGLRGDSDIDSVLQARDAWENSVVTGPRGAQVLARFGFNLVPGSFARQLVRRLDSLHRAFDFVVIDAGCCPHAAEVLWPVAEQSILITTPDPLAVTNAYALLKVLGVGQLTWNVGFVVNQCRDDVTAEEVTNRMRESCRKFLNFDLDALRAIPFNAELAQTAQGRTVGRAGSSVATTSMKHFAEQVDHSHCPTL